MNEQSNWLTDLYERFDKIIQRLLAEEPFWQPCSTCSEPQCCHSTTVPVTDTEWGLMARHVRDTFDEQQKHTLLSNIESSSRHCPFLFGSKCSVYPVRPWACRITPYTVSFDESDPVRNITGLFLPYCSTLAPYFGQKSGHIVYQEPIVLDRQATGPLVKLGLNIPGPLWFIDGSGCFREYEEKIPESQDEKPQDNSIRNRVDFSRFLRDESRISEAEFLEGFGLH